MSILDVILSGIVPGFQRRKPEAKAAPKPAPKPAPGAAAGVGTTAAPPRVGENVSFNPAQNTDIEAHLDGLAARADQKLNWRTSIVDLMKLLDIDSSLQNRKELAKELGYTGDMSDSAAMNIWLHKQVMRRVAANGGKVPANLTD